MDYKLIFSVVLGMFIYKIIIFVISVITGVVVKRRKERELDKAFENPVHLRIKISDAIEVVNDWIKSDDIKYYDSQNIETTGMRVDYHPGKLAHLLVEKIA